MVTTVPPVSGPKLGERPEICGTGGLTVMVTVAVAVLAVGVVESVTVSVAV